MLELRNYYYLYSYATSLSVHINGENKLTELLLVSLSNFWLRVSRSASSFTTYSSVSLILSDRRANTFISSGVASLLRPDDLPDFLLRKTTAPLAAPSSSSGGFRTNVFSMVMIDDRFTSSWIFSIFCSNWSFLSDTDLRRSTTTFVSLPLSESSKYSSQL